MMRLSRIPTILTAFLVSGSVYATCNANLVRSKPDVIYINHGNGTVTDTQTGLMWQKCSLGLSGTNCGTGTALKYTWKTALESALTANAGLGTFGYTDWRLPSVAELRTLQEKACWNPTINATIFPATVASYYYWTSSIDGDSSHAATAAWVVWFDGNLGVNSGELYRSKDDNVYGGYVRLVRDAL